MVLLNKEHKNETAKGTLLYVDSEQKEPYPGPHFYGAISLKFVTFRGLGTQTLTMTRVAAGRRARWGQELGALDMLRRNVKHEDWWHRRFSLMLRLSWLVFSLNFKPSTPTPFSHALNQHPFQRPAPAEKSAVKSGHYTYMCIYIYIHIHVCVRVYSLNKSFYASCCQRGLPHETLGWPGFPIVCKKPMSEG